jgi:hypothetical protein
LASDQSTLTVSGTVTANAGTGTFNIQQSNITADYDTGAGTQNLTMFGIALPASGGAVAGGTATNPIRTDPTGTTTQPVSGTVTANAGSGTFNIQANASVNVNQIAGAAVSTAASGTQLVGIADGAGGALTSNSTTFTAKKGLDANILGTLGTAFTTPGFVDIKGADGNVFVRQATASNLNAQVVGTVASGASDSGNPVKVGGIFNTTQPTVTTGQRVDAQMTARGAAIVSTGVDVFHVTVDAMPTTTVTGTITANQGGAPWSENITQFGGVSVNTGTGASGTGTPRVTVANDSAVIMQGGAKGTTTVAAVTSTASGVNHQPLDVAIYDAAGAQITSFGGGTQYAENTTQATATGTVALGKNTSNVVFPLQLDTNKNLEVGGGSANGTALTASENPVLSGGSDQGWGPGLPPGAAPSKRVAYVDLYGRQHIICDNCGGQPVVNIPTANGLGRTIAAAIPIAGSLGQQITATGNALDVNVKYGDPCSGRHYPISISQTASSVLLKDTPGAITICSGMVVASDAETLSLVMGQGTTCATNTVAVIGGTTAAAGTSLSANNGWAVPNIGTLRSAGDICLLQSGAGTVAGYLSVALSAY